MTAILQQCLSNNQPVYFMPTEVSDDTEYVKGASTYILRIAGTLIDGQKVYTYLPSDKKHGEFIMYLGLVVFLASTMKFALLFLGLHI